MACVEATIGGPDCKPPPTASKTFEGPFAATNVSVTDLSPALNGSKIGTIVNFNDVRAVIIGFSASHYHFPRIEPCEDQSWPVTFCDLPHGSIVTGQ
ncbi:MAG: hypothetical protein IIA12_00970 [Proteobacteria bacterium]|nr:hypothetical protein [Pseudomonadota bacterium]